MTCLVLSFDRTVRKFCAYRHGADTPTLRSAAKSDPNPQRFASRSITGLLLLLLCCSAVALSAQGRAPAKPTPLTSSPSQVSSGILTFTPSVITTIAGQPGVRSYSGDGGPASLATLHFPNGIAIDTQGNLYVADAFNNVVRKIDTTGIITTVAGNNAAGAGYAGDGGPATSAQLNDPAGVSLDTAGNLYIAEINNNVIRRVDAKTQTITTVAGNNTAGAGYGGDGGPATSAQLNGPSDIVVTPDGNTLFIADDMNNVIRMVDLTTGNATSGQISTVAGTGKPGWTADGAALSTELNNPSAVALDSLGNVFIADSNNFLIRKLILVKGGTNAIATVAGSYNASNPSPGYTGDGGQATLATLSQMKGLFVDQANDIFISDTGNFVIRKVDAASGNINTVAGLNSAAGNTAGDGGPATSASLSYVDGIVMDTAGSLYFTDNGNHIVKKVGPTGDLVFSAPGATLTLTIANVGSQALTPVSSQNAPQGVIVPAGFQFGPGSVANSCFNLANGPIALSSGQICTVTVTAPTGSSAASGQLETFTNDPNSPGIANLIVGTGGFLSASPGALSFTAATASPITEVLTLTNAGNKPINSTATSGAPPFMITGTGAATFAPGQGGGAPCNFTTTLLQPGATCTLGITFTPPATAGTSTASLTFLDDATNSTLAIGLSGVSSGAAPPPMAIATTTAITSPASGTTITPGLTGAVFSASVKPASGPAVAEGSVTFTSSDSPPVSASGTVTAGVASATLILPANPSDTITATYTDPSGTYSTSSGSTSVVVEDQNFSITVAPASAVLNILQGGSGTLTFTYTPVYGFSGTIATPSTSICSSISANLSCTFNPATVTLPGTGSNGSATSILTICTSNPCSSSSGAMLEPSAFRQDGQIYAAAAFLSVGNKASEGVNSKWPIRLTSFFGFFGILLLTMVRRGARKTGDMRGVLRSTLAPMLLVLGLFLMTSGCGSSSKPPVPPPATNVVPKGTYPVTFTFTSGTGASAITEAVKLQIVVQ